ncbi:hypothetical protein GOV10_03320, partial [Candidatus Woesearchaeota archaeon]|nr:hypothetical protein [Candidatus Woesearchaeota archaeon]
MGGEDFDTRIDEIVLLIKEKKELQSLDDNFIKKKILVKIDSKTKEKLEGSKSVAQFSRSKEYNALRSAVRKELRETYGVFELETRDLREKLLAQLKTTEEKDLVVRELLATHQSSRERLPFYSLFYEELKKIIPRWETVLELGCGLNPISYPLLVEKIGATPKYICCDIASSDMRFLTEYFTTMNITGEACVLDAHEHEAVETILEQEKPDVVFMLKLLDTLESTQRHNTKKLLPRIAIHTKYLVVSFATISLGGGKTIGDD